MERFDFNKLVNPCCNNLLNRNFLGDNAFAFEHKGSTDVADMTNVVNVLNSGALKTSTKFKNNANPFCIELKTTKAGDKSLDFLALIPQVKGLSIGGYVENKLKTGTDFSLSSQFSNQTYTGRLNVEPINRKVTLFGLGKFKLSCGGLTAGSHLNFDFKTKNLNYILAAAYETNLNDSCLKTSLRFKGANVKPFHPSLVSDIVVSSTPKGAFKKTLGAEAEYFIAENKVAFTVAAQWFLTPNNAPRQTFVKAKCNHDYKAEIALTHALTDNLSCTVSTQGTVAKDFNPQDIKFGFRLSLS